MKFLGLIAIVLAPHFAGAAEKPKGYDAFALVRTRNIFDPNRKPVRKEAEQPRNVAPSRPKSVHLSLTGTMVTDGRTLAFFTGSRSEFNKIISVGEKIADFKVAAISAGQVDLDQGGKATTLLVGKRMQLEGTEPDPAEPDPVPSVPAASTTSTEPGKPAAPTASAAPPASGGSPSDILKRMMERRAQEMKK